MSGFTKNAGAAFDKQTRVARKERKDFQAKMERYETIRRKVERDQQNISRQNPHGGFLLKKKMHTIQAMGRRFEREPGRHDRHARTGRGHLRQTRLRASARG